MKFDETFWNYPEINQCRVAIIGLGYVGLPLAVEIAKRQKSYLTGENLERSVIGFDVDKKRIEELKRGLMKSCQVSC